MKLIDLKPSENMKVLLYGNSGSGKCLGINTPVLMYDGTVKLVQNIKVGDLVMGPDSKPRKVLSLGRGRSEMYEVMPVKGDSFRCNKEHILTLWSSNRKELFDISVKEFTTSYKSEATFCLARIGVDFPSIKWESKIHPYEAGAWLGDGHMRAPAITKNDIEIKLMWENLCKRFKINCITAVDKRNGVLTHRATIGKARGRLNPVQEELKFFKENGEKNIPHWALTSSRKDRMQLLAGLIDTDGYCGSNTIEWSSKSSMLADQFIFLSRSLGLAAYKSPKEVKDKTYWRVSLSGELSDIPTRIDRKTAKKRGQIKNVLHTGFALVPEEEDDYYGFTLNGDGRFLLGDFTITHNTVAALSFPKPMYVFDFDGKISSGASFYQGEEWLKDIEYDSYLKKGLSDQPVERMNTLLGKFRDQECPYRTVVIDSLTTYTEQAFPYLIKMNPGIKRMTVNKAAVPSMQDYGIFKIFTRELITQALGLPCNVVMLAHLDTKKDETSGRLVNRPLMAGSLQSQLDVYFEEVYHTYVEEGKYWAQTQSDSKFDCRTQIKGLPAKVELKYESLVGGAL